MNDKDKELCPRLIDFLVVVGKRCRKGQNQNDTTNLAGVSYPEILRRYPNDDHKDFQLPAEVTLFCQPEGCNTIDLKNKRPGRKDPHFFVFMLTEKDSAKIRYGICLNFYETFENKVKTPEGEKTDSYSSLTSLCFISHHPFVSVFHSLLCLLKKIIDGCNQRASLKTKQKNLIWSTLTGRWNEPIPVEAMSEIKEIETWILMLLSSPVPVPGKTKVQLEVMPLDMSQIYEFALPDHTRFSLIDFPLHIPFELLGIDMALRVLTAAMLEFKVLIQSRNFNAVSMCVLSVVALLYPLEYMFPVIPLLPAYMPSAEQLLLAPTPFLIGVPSSFFEHRKITELPSDVILVDLDTNSMNVPDELYIPDLPEPDAGELKRKLKNAMKKMNTMLVNSKQTVDNDHVDLDLDSVDVACRVAMVQFFNSDNVFGNFSEHTRTLRLYPRPVVSLQTDSFLRSRPVATQFITDLCRTQAVEYFAECCLCPKNETFVRVQAGIENPVQVGDKAKWFSESLMPVHFMVYREGSQLAEAVLAYNIDDTTSLVDLDETASQTASSIEELVLDDSGAEKLLKKSLCSEEAEITKPLAHVDDVYKEPRTLELPQSESAVSIGSSISSGRSSPASSLSTSAIDSEADFARLADNLALKSNSQGAFSFDHGSDSETESTPVSQRRKTIHAMNEAQDEKNKTGRMKGFSTLTDSGEKVLGPAFMNAFNGYAEKSQHVFSQVLNRTAPKAQALKEKTIKPLATKIEQSQHMVRTKALQNPTSQQTANQQSKSQQMIKEFCDQALAGQSVGIFAAPKLRRLVDDESMREMVCSKLNLGLENKLSEDEYVKEVQLTKKQFKAYVKILKYCIEGIESSFNTPGCCGLASVFHVLEIAHTHYWTSSGSEAMTPISSAPSLSATPMEPPSDGIGEVRTKLPATEIDLRTPTKPLGQVPAEKPENPTQTESATEAKAAPPPIPPRGSTKRAPPPRIPAPKLPQEAVVKIPPPLPPRPNAPKPETSVPTSTSSPAIPNIAPIEPVKTVTPPKTLPVEKQEPQKVLPTPNEPVRHYVYQDLILSNHSPIWQNPQFWEIAFVDLVAQEREIVGMDQEPSEMIDRYSALGDPERKRLELEEDRLLSTLLHNMTAYMVMCGTGQRSLQQKVRRLLGKAHIGLICSKEINKLLDELPTEQGNFIPLKPLGSRLVQKQSFTVTPGPESDAQVMFMEVCDDAVVLRSVSGAVSERWWYERLVNMTYSPKTKILCLWRRHDDKVFMHKFHTKKCRELYQCMKTAMERAASRGKVQIEGRALGGEFPIHDTETNLGGLLQVRCDGVQVIFAASQTFIALSNIKKCNTFGGNVFLLEEYDRKKDIIIQRRYFSQMADQICYAVLCVFSLAAAGHKKNDDNQR